MMFEERLHIIVSFSTDERIIQESSNNALFKELRDKVIIDIHGKPMELQGLSPQDIGEWIKIARGVDKLLNV